MDIRESNRSVEPRSGREDALTLLSRLEREISAIQQRRVDMLIEIANAEDRGDWGCAADLRARVGSDHRSRVRLARMTI